MSIGTGPADRANHALRLAVEAASGRAPVDHPQPRHRAGAWIDDTRVVTFPDPGRSFGDPRPSPTSSVGFRSNQDVVSEMPVIYRPGGDRKPEKPERRDRATETARRAVAPPSVPTAASYADPRPPVGRYDGFDEDPDITDDELDAAADDAILDSLDAVDGPRTLDASGLEVEVAPPAREPRTKGRRPEPAVVEPWDTPSPPPPAETFAPEPVAETPVAPSQPQRYSVPRPRYTPLPGQPVAAPEPVAPAEPDWIAEEPIEEPAAIEVPIETRRPRVRTLHISAPPTGPGEEIAPIEEPARPVTSHRAEQPDDSVAEYAPVEDVPPAPTTRVRAASAISGRVSSSRGRGLSGITVSLVDRHDDVITSVGTGRHGEYAFAQVDPGTYRVVVTDDIDGDFAPSCFGGHDIDDAEPVTLDDPAVGLSDVDVTMRSAVTLDTQVDVRRRKTVLELLVTDNATGLPAIGTARVTTEAFSAALPLTKGRAEISLIGSTEEWGAGVPRLPKRVRVEFTGGKHSAPTTRTIKLR